MGWWSQIASKHGFWADSGPVLAWLCGLTSGVGLSPNHKWPTNMNVRLILGQCLPAFGVRLSLDQKWPSNMGIGPIPGQCYPTVGAGYLWMTSSQQTWVLGQLWASVCQHWSSINPTWISSCHIGNFCHLPLISTSLLLLEVHLTNASTMDLMKTVLHSRWSINSSHL